MSAHTAGPWVQFFDRDAGTITIMPAMLEGDIATVPIAENGEANARLMTAAPELLAAAIGVRETIADDVEVLLRSYCSLDDNLNPQRETLDPDEAYHVEELERQLAALDAAIAKATTP